MIYSSPLPDVEIPDLPLTAYVLAGAAGQPDKPALIDGVSGQTLTYADLERAVGSLAGGLAASGFAKGDVLALMAPNMPEYAVVFHAVAMAGGIVTTINPTYAEAEVHGQLRDSGARILVTIPPLAAAASRAAARTQVEEVYVFGEAPGAGRWRACTPRRWPGRCRSSPEMWWPCRTPQAPWGCPRASCSPMAIWSPTLRRRWPWPRSCRRKAWSRCCRSSISMACRC